MHIPPSVAAQIGSLKNRPPKIARLQHVRVLVAAGKKKGPDYSSVTARESLANIRERQAAEARLAHGAAAPPPPPTRDATYETVNYDAVKVRNVKSHNARRHQAAQTSSFNTQPGVVRDFLGEARWRWSERVALPLDGMGQLPFKFPM